jgi:hypothetical protein
MRAEVLKCLVNIEQQGEIPPDLRIKQYTPESKELNRILALIHEFLRPHRVLAPCEAGDVTNCRYYCKKASTVKPMYIYSMVYLHYRISLAVFPIP